MKSERTKYKSRSFVRANKMCQTISFDQTPKNF